MKKSILLFLIFCLVNCINAQSYEYTYEFIKKEYPTNIPIKKIAKVLASVESTQSLYTLNKIENEKQEVKNYADYVVLPENDYQYILYSENGRNYQIQDFIQGKYYHLYDTPAMNWNLSSETKILKGTKLYKATTNFRGRNYTVWYEKNDKIKAHPWKFNGIPGIVVEAYDDQDDFHWTLVGKHESNLKISNLFKGTETFQDYSIYPKLRYALSPKMEAALSQNPNRTIFEQPRVDLEIKFENEKKP